MLLTDWRVLFYVVQTKGAARTGTHVATCATSRAPARNECSNNAANGMAGQKRENQQAKTGSSSDEDSGPLQRQQNPRQPPDS